MTYGNDDEKTPQDQKDGCVPTILVWGGWFGSIFLLAYLHDHYPGGLSIGVVIVVVSGVIYALIRHTETALKAIVFLLALAVFGFLAGTCRDMVHHQTYEGVPEYR